MNITLTIDDEIVEKVSKIAVDKNTTLTAMVLEFLASVADTETPSLDAAAQKEAADKLRAHIAFRANRPAEERDQTGSEEAVNQLQESWDRLSRSMGPRNWTRDDLYNRPYAYRKRD